LTPPATRATDGAPRPGASSPAEAFRFAVKGDWGAGTAAQHSVTARMCEVRKSRPFSIVLTTGDNFYAPDGLATSRTYFRPEICLNVAPPVTWRAAWGNHDVAGDSTAGVLGSARRTFRFSAGGVDFFVLDSNAAADDAQRRWLEDALASSRAAVKIVAFHHPPYTVGAGHLGDARIVRNWVPLFRRFNVTLVLTGHNHDYEHSLVDGVDYVVTGGGGAAVYPCVREAPWNIACMGRHHFLLVEVRGSAVTVTAIAPGGEEIDRFSIQA
jgi:acid phosphatase